jgi:glycine betaine transporter
MVTPKLSRSALLLSASLVTISVIGIWGVFDPEGIVASASVVVDQYYDSRGWFVMLTV